MAFTVEPSIALEYEETQHEVYRSKTSKHLPLPLSPTSAASTTREQDKVDLRIEAHLHAEHMEDKDAARLTQEHVAAVEPREEKSQDVMKS